MIKKMKREDFDKVYAIMEQSFPPDERRPYKEQQELLENPLYSVYIVENLYAFIATWEFDEFVFIEHFAVKNECRNTGLGSRMLSEFLEKQKKTVCLEVELPETELAKRRIGFYERNGFYFNEFEYFQPPISQGKKIIPLRIMTSNAGIDKVTFEKIRSILYKEVYKFDI